MTNHAAPSARGAARPSLAGTVFRLTAVAAIAAVLIWSVLFADLLRKRADTSVAPAPLSGQATGPGTAAPAPAPVTTRTS
jgi:hypothetical protein